METDSKLNLGDEDKNPSSVSAETAAETADPQSCVAGRELDRLIAERVMGWTLDRTSRDSEIEQKAHPGGRIRWYEVDDRGYAIASENDARLIGSFVVVAFHEDG